MVGEAVDELKEKSRSACSAKLSETRALMFMVPMVAPFTLTEKLERRSELAAARNVSRAGVIGTSGNDKV